MSITRLNASIGYDHRGEKGFIMEPCATEPCVTEPCVTGPWNDDEDCMIVQTNLLCWWPLRNRMLQRCLRQIKAKVDYSLHAMLY